MIFTESQLRFEHSPNDLVRTHQLWGKALCASPQQIWSDFIAFTPSPFLVADIRGDCEVISQR